MRRAKKFRYQKTELLAELLVLLWEEVSAEPTDENIARFDIAMALMKGHLDDEF